MKRQRITAKRKGIAIAAGTLAIMIGIGGCSDTAGKDASKETNGVIQAAGEAGMEEIIAETEKNEEMTSEKAIFEFKERKMADEKLLEECDKFASLVEQYMENVSFLSVEDGQAEELTKLLSGHYEVAGRKAEDGRAYYMAVRRSDAPVYEDFDELSVGYVYYAGSAEEVCQIGYYDKNAEERTLYEIPGYLVTLCMDREEALNMFCLIPQGESDDEVFLSAFQESGRKKLDFIGKHSGLSYHEEGKNCIDFYYQDKDTLEFCSEPYSCCISLDEAESEKIRTFLEKDQDQKQEFSNHREAMEWLRKENPSARTTGASLNLDGCVYELLGSRESEGYVIGRKEDMACWLKSEEQIYSYVLGRIEEAVGKDYGDFTDSWFDGGLAKASLAIPRMEEGEDGEWARKIGRQSITETEKLERLSKLLGSAIRGHEALNGCPYIGVLDLERADGETLQMFVAADSCDSLTYDGRIGFEYGKQQELAEIFDEAMKQENSADITK